MIIAKERAIPRVNILGVQVDAITVAQLHAALSSLIDTSQHALVLNVNAHCLNLACKHRWLTDLLNSATVVFCDGVGVMIGARVLGVHIPERITYADWMWQLAGFAESLGYTCFFLGARAGVADKAAERLKERFPGLHIVGTHHGYFNKAPGSQENEAVIRAINAARPNILVLGLGMPLQEHWLMENWNRVDANIALTGGATFDYLSGELRRAPRWMTDNGLEWLGRLTIEPRRLWRRYLVGNPLFLLRVLSQRMGLIQFCGRGGDQL